MTTAKVLGAVAVGAGLVWLFRRARPAAASVQSGERLINAALLRISQIRQMLQEGKISQEQAKKQVEAVASTVNTAISHIVAGGLNIAISDPNAPVAVSGGQQGVTVGLPGTPYSIFVPPSTTFFVGDPQPTRLDSQGLAIPLTNAPELSRIVFPDGSASITYTDGTVVGISAGIVPPPPAGSLVTQGPLLPDPTASPAVWAEQQAAYQAWKASLVV